MYLIDATQSTNTGVLPYIALMVVGWLVTDWFAASSLGDPAPREGVGAQPILLSLPRAGVPM